MTATKQTAQTCRWADPAIYLAFQDWTAIWNSSWRCVRGATPRPLASATECEACPHWEQRAPADVAWTIAAVGL